MIDQFEKIIPAKYVPFVAFAVLCLPYVGRAIAALRNGHGIKGVLRAIWQGDPKPGDVVKAADAQDLARAAALAHRGDGPQCPPEAPTQPQGQPAATQQAQGPTSTLVGS